MISETEGRRWSLELPTHLCSAEVTLEGVAVAPTSFQSRFYLSGPTSVLKSRGRCPVNWYWRKSPARFPLASTYGCLW